MIIKAGRFSLDVWEGGSPIWCQLSVDGEEKIHGIDSKELDDLAYIIKKARRTIKKEDKFKSFR